MRIFVAAVALMAACVVLGGCSIKVRSTRHRSRFLQSNKF
jgi:hypothetical protein